MSKAEILAELSKLDLEERREIFARLGELEEQELLKGAEPAADEKVLLDRELEDFKKNPSAGSSWEEVEANIRKQSKS